MGLLQMIWRTFLAWLVMKLSKITQPEEPNPAEPNYTVDYRGKNNREYFQNGLSRYNWNPRYKSGLDDLYDNKGSFYREMFKYREPKDY